MTILRLEQVSKSYGAGKPVLLDLDLAVEEGEFLTILGASGSGKSTLLRILNALIPFEAGWVEVKGKLLSQWDPVALRREMGYVIQNVGLFPHLTVEGNIGYVLSLMGWKKEEIAERVRELLALTGLSRHLLGRYPRELSGGQKQRVGVARALAARPGILLMDEPFGAVDELTRLQLQKELQAIHRELGVTILLVTHDIGEALRLGNRVLLLQEGRVAQLGTPEELLFQPASQYVREFLGGRGLFSALSPPEMEMVYSQLLEQGGSMEAFHRLLACERVLKEKEGGS